MRDGLKIALNMNALKMLGAGAAGGALVGGPTYLLTKWRDAQEKERAKNLSFGAGVATGFSAPRILRGLYNIAQGNDAPGMPEMPGLSELGMGQGMGMGQ